jgi:hypothetical protein
MSCLKRTGDEELQLIPLLAAEHIAPPLIAQQRWLRVCGHTSSTACQNPSAPSATASSGPIDSPRRFVIEEQFAPRVRTLAHPVGEADNLLLPSGVGKRMRSEPSARFHAVTQLSPIAPLALPPSDTPTIRSRYWALKNLGSVALQRPATQKTKMGSSRRVAGKDCPRYLRSAQESSALISAESEQRREVRVIRILSL